MFIAPDEESLPLRSPVAGRAFRRPGGGPSWRLRRQSVPGFATCFGPRHCPTTRCPPMCAGRRSFRHRATATLGRRPLSASMLAPSPCDRRTSPHQQADPACAQSWSPAAFFLGVVVLRFIARIDGGRSGWREIRSGCRPMPPVFRSTPSSSLSFAKAERRAATGCGPGATCLAARAARHQADRRGRRPARHRRAVERVAREPPFEVVVVPPIGPRTKPKALHLSPSLSHAGNSSRSTTPRTSPIPASSPRHMPPSAVPDRTLPASKPRLSSATRRRASSPRLFAIEIGAVRRPPAGACDLEDPAAARRHLEPLPPGCARKPGAGIRTT